MAFKPTQYCPYASIRLFGDQFAAFEETKLFAVIHFCPEQTCICILKEDDNCGCKDQCEAIGKNMNNDGFNDDACVDVCKAQCKEFVKV